MLVGFASGFGGWLTVSPPPLFSPTPVKHWNVRTVELNSSWIMHMQCIRTPTTNLALIVITALRSFLEMSKNSWKFTWNCAQPSAMVTPICRFSASPFALVLLSRFSARWSRDEFGFETSHRSSCKRLWFESGITGLQGSPSLSKNATWKALTQDASCNSTMRSLWLVYGASLKSML